MTDSDSQPMDLALEWPFAVAAVDVVVEMVDLKDMAAAVIVVGEGPADKVVDVGDMVAAAGVAVAAVEQVRRPRAYIPRVNNLWFAAADIIAGEDILAGGRRSGWRRMRC